MSTHNPRPFRAIRPAVFTLALATLSVTFCSSNTFADPPRYTLEIFTPAGNHTYSTPLGMNESGQLAGYSAAGPWEPISAPTIVADDGEIIELPAADPGYNFVYNGNESGVFVGISNRQAHAWVNGRLHPLPVPSTVFSGAARDISERGVIVGAYGEFDEIGPQHCVWTNQNAPPILLRGVSRNNASGSAWAMNSQGQIAGVSGGTEGVFFAVRWDRLRARPRKLGLLPGAFNSEAVALNNHGDVVGRSSSDTFVEAFLYSDETRDMVGLGFLPGGGSYSFAWGINDARQVVGVSSAGQATIHGFLWQDGVMHDLNDLVDSPPTGVECIASASAINNAGQIAVAVVVTTLTGSTSVMGRLTPTE